MLRYEMADNTRPPIVNFDRGGFVNGVNTEAQAFWFEAKEEDGYRWHVKGQYNLDAETGITITSWVVESASGDEEEQPTRALRSELMRKLVALSPLVERIRSEEIRYRRFTREARRQLQEVGDKSAVLDRWIEEQKKTEQALKPWRSQISDDEWAKWSRDLLDRVGSWGSMYNVVKKITETKAWGDVAYETNRDRVKAMRKYGWIEGKGAQTREGPRLRAYTKDREATDG